MGNSFSFDDTTSTVTSRIWNLGDLTSNTNDTFSKSYINAGTYNVTLKVTNAYNCADSIIKTINVKANPIQPIISAVSNSQLESTTANAYQWYKDGNMLNGASYQTLMLTSNGSYTVKIDSSNLCSNLSNPFIASSVGVNEMVSEKVIKIYPNPAINELHIVTQGSEKLSVQLFDFTGKEASERIVFSHSTDINTQLLSEGMYFVKISDANGAVVKTEQVFMKR